VTRRRITDPQPRLALALPLALPLVVPAALAALFVIFLLVDRDGPTTTDWRSEQIDYRSRLAENRAALVPGTLRYPSRVGVDAGEPATLTVTLDLGMPPTSGDADPSPRAVEVPAGGIVSARLVGDGEVAIESQSPERQPVAVAGDEGRWRFAVTVPDPGDRELALTVVTYLAATDEPLATSGPFVVRVDAGATFGYRLRQAGGLVTGLLAFAGVSGGVALTWLWRRLRRRRRRRATAAPAAKPEAPKSDPPEPEAPKPEPPEPEPPKPEPPKPEPPEQHAVD
jgi:hypothetical protein